MPFSSLMTDIVSLIKKDGTKINNIKSSVQDKKIFIDRSDILIESGDLIHRKMSNGAEETYKVIDPGFHEKFHQIPAGYNMKCKKLGVPEAKKAIQNITYNNTVNIHGNNQGIAVSGNENQSNLESSEYNKIFIKLIEEVKNSNIKDKHEIVENLESQKEDKIKLQSYLGTLLTRGAEITTLTPVIVSLLGLLI